jgi:hypothetical protein
VQFKKNNPQRKINNRRKKYGTYRNLNNKFTWAIDIPKSFDKFTNIFQNECFITSVILGYLQNEYYKTNKSDKRYLYAQNINSKCQKSQSYAGKIILKELTKLKSELNISNGPYELESIAESVCDYYKCQIFIYSGLGNSTNLKTIFPKNLDESRSPIYLFETKSNHVIFIRQITVFFKKNQKICTYCKRKFKSCRFLHRCDRKLTCFVCRRRFQEENTYINSMTSKNFCDKKISPNFPSKKCPRCNLILYTKHCEKGHSKLCNGKGHFGWYCAKCKHFTYKTQKFTSQDLKKRHKCGITSCRICRELMNPDELHLCRLREEKCSKLWPLMSFLNIEFSELNSNTCTICFELKDNFKKKNDFSWKQVFENKMFPSLFCSEHKNREIIYDPLIFSINKENRSKRGVFSTYTFSNICDKDHDEETISYNYFSPIKEPRKFLPSKPIATSLQQIKSKLERNLDNLTNRFFNSIIDESWTNSTIVINDEDSMKMASKP